MSSGYGDGDYPVEVRRNEEGRIAEMRIRFITHKERAMRRRLMKQARRA
jgi:hypothetical protein